MFNFNRDSDYIQTVSETKTLLKELIAYFDGLTKKVDTKKLEELIDQIDNPFMMLICGEFSSGKSTFINALLGEKLCKVGPTRTTDKINIIKNSSDKIKIKAKKDNNELVINKENDTDNNYEIMTEGIEDTEIINQKSLNTEMLDSNFLIVDTPGLNSIMEEHEKLTLGFLYKSELILFVMSIDRAFSESERKVLELITEQYGKKVVFILNKIDQKTNEEINEVIQDVEENSLKFLGFKPVILSISSKQAFDGITNNDKELIKKSKLKEVVKDINDIYKRNALFLKLDSPLSTSLKLIEEVSSHIDIDSKAIEEEHQKLVDFMHYLEQYKIELIDHYKEEVINIRSSFAEVENAIYKIIDSITFGKLIKSKFPVKEWKIKYNFEGKIQELTRKVNLTLENLTDNVAKDLRNFHEKCAEFINKQLETYKRKNITIHTASPDFIETRKNILNTLRDTFDHNYNMLKLPDESNSMKKSIEEGFTASVVGTTLSVAVGGGLIAILPSLALDITGLSLAIVLAVSSLFILPSRKKKAKKVLSEKFDGLCDKLTSVTVEKIKEDIQNNYSQIERELRPYKAFVKSEKEVIKRNKIESEKLREKINAIKSQVVKRFKNKRSNLK